MSRAVSNFQCLLISSWKKLKYWTWTMRACIPWTLPLSFHSMPSHKELSFSPWENLSSMLGQLQRWLPLSEISSSFPLSQLGLGKGLLLNATSPNYWNPGHSCPFCSSIPSPSVSSQQSTRWNYLVHSFVCMLTGMNQWICYVKYAYSIEKAVQTWGEDIPMMAR